MTIRFQVPQEKIPVSGARAFLQIEGKNIALFHIGTQFYAIEDRCPHQGTSLFSGKLEGQAIRCCAHGLVFDLATGYMLNSKHLKVATYPVEVDAAQLFILIDTGENND